MMRVIHSCRHDETEKKKKKKKKKKKIEINCYTNFLLEFFINTILKMVKAL